MKTEQQPLFPLDDYTNPIKPRLEHPLGLSDDAQGNLEYSFGYGAADGTPYLPSNGSEGCSFTSAWCDRCLKQPLDPAKGGCSILLKSMVGEQPKQWLIAKGKACCTKFKLRKRAKKLIK